jgi:hypothetical protein
MHWPLSEFFIIYTTFQELAVLSLVGIILLDILLLYFVFSTLAAVIGFDCTTAHLTYTF